ncbi:MAG TPA: TadE/TadG family type IV pilus assembly protein [Xanthobacteraceae bacterium]|nr:TadE/TadG family type IV pilus assembly protein [Xanthobacteraceae bacterium]
MIRRIVALRLLWSDLRRIARDQRGASVVEFALLLPLMVTLYLGTVEISQGIAVDRKLTLTARTVADLASQYTTINNAVMNDIMAASTAVMYPYSTNTLTVTVTSVKIDSNSKATVDWSNSYNGTPRAKNSTVTVPAALLVPNTWLIWSEVQYSYTPTIGYVLTGTLTLKDQLYMAPRLSNCVLYPEANVTTC